MPLKQKYYENAAATIIKNLEKRQMVITGRSGIPGRIKVILIGEELGY